VGGAGSVVINNGGGLAGQIYGVRAVADLIGKRAALDANSPYDYTWAGVPVAPGMPMPGTWSGFTGTLSGANIPAAGAFLVGLIWFLVALGLVSLCIISLKGSLEGLASMKLIKEDRMGFFRRHWIRYLAASVLRTFFIAFFMITTLALYQFNMTAPIGATAIAGVTFALIVLGISGVVAYACRARLRFGKFTMQPDQLILHHGKIFNVVPCVAPVRASTLKEQESAARPLATLSWFRLRHIDDDPSRATVHKDETYVRSFGWLSARYRQTRWWFFAYYLGYQFVRACFLGGGVQSPLAQVYGLFIVEVVAFIIIAHLSPFEGLRNTALAVWMLSITKVVTAGLSIAFLPDFGLDRIVATVLGFIIIVVQGLLVIALMILVVLGTISSWMSLSRNHEDFSPELLDSFRTRYFEKMEAKAADDPYSRKRHDQDHELELKELQLALSSLRRPPKIDEEEADVITSLGLSPLPLNVPPIPRPASVRSLPRTRTRSRANSLNSRSSSGSLGPRGAARVPSHRASWSSKDFAQWDAAQSSAAAMAERPSSAMLAKRLSGSGNGIVGSRPPSASSLRVVQTLADVKHPSPLGPGRPDSAPSKEALARHTDESKAADLRISDGIPEAQEE